MSNLEKTLFAIGLVFCILCFFIYIKGSNYLAAIWCAYCIILLLLQFRLFSITERIIKEYEKCLDDYHKLLLEKLK